MGRLAVERQRHADQIEGVERERNLEKESMEAQMVQLVEQQRCQSPVRGVQDRREQEEQRRKDREEELISTVQRLTTRVQAQDQDLAEAKEDNIVLRSQIRCLKGEKKK